MITTYLDERESELFSVEQDGRKLSLILIHGGFLPSHIWRLVEADGSEEVWAEHHPNYAVFLRRVQEITSAPIEKRGQMVSELLHMASGQWQSRTAI